MIYTDGVHLVCFPFVEEELHDFASLIDLKRCWYQRGKHPHYDLTTPRKARAAVNAGAVLVECMDIGRMFRAYRTGKAYTPTALLDHDVEAKHIKLMSIFRRKK